MTRIFFAIALFAGLAACMSDRPQRLDAPGEASLLLSFGRDDNCTLQGDGIRIQQNENMLGKGFTAAGQIRSSTIVCTDTSGRQFATTDHRSVVTGTYAQLSVSNITAGPQRVVGIVTRGRREFEYRGTFTFRAL